jgi:Phage capsid family
MQPAPGITHTLRETTPVFQRRRDPPLPGNLLTRYIAAQAKAFVAHTSPIEIVRDCWPDDLGLQMLVRAVSTPAQLGQVGWAQELGRRLVNDSLDVLYPASASAALFQLAPSLTFGNEAVIAVPGLAAGTVGKTSAFVAERQPIPVFQPALTDAVLLPHKLAGIIVATREVIESSNAETLTGDLVRQSFGRALDEALVDANPATPQRPAGLRNGIAAITPTTGSDAWGNFVADVSKLADAVGPVAGNAPIAFIGSAGRAMRARVLGLEDLENVEMFGSNAVINDFLCVATAALVSAVGVPEIEVNKVATVSLDDAPVADPTTPVGPFRSLWQTDAFGIKCRWPISWALRDPRGFAWMTPTGW